MLVGLAKVATGEMNLTMEVEVDVCDSQTRVQFPSSPKISKKFFPHTHTHTHTWGKIFQNFEWE